MIMIIDCDNAAAASVDDDDIFIHWVINVLLPVIPSYDNKW